MMSAARLEGQMEATFQSPRHRRRTPTPRPALQTLATWHHHCQVSITLAVLRRRLSIPWHRPPLKPSQRHIPLRSMKTIHCSLCLTVHTPLCSRSCWHQHSVRRMTRRSCSRAGSRMHCGRGKSQHGQLVRHASTLFRCACTALHRCAQSYCSGFHFALRLLNPQMRLWPVSKNDLYAYHAVHWFAVMNTQAVTVRVCAVGCSQVLPQTPPPLSDRVRHFQGMQQTTPAVPLHRVH